MIQEGLCNDPLAAWISWRAQLLTEVESQVARLTTLIACLPPGADYTDEAAQLAAALVIQTHLRAACGEPSALVGAIA